MVNSMHWYEHVLWRWDVCVLRRALESEVQSQRGEGEAKKDLDEAGRGVMHEGSFV